jgi:D-alanine-D-alanine ligase
MNKDKKNIGVFFGSGSPEHDISIITAQLIIAGLKGLGYLVTPIYITKKGKWMIGEELGNMKAFIDAQKKVEDQKKLFEYYLDLENSSGKMVFKKKGLAGKSITVDIAFPALHGSFGEDGTIQGLFEMFGIPYVGCDVASSAISMDKALTKQMYEQHKIPTTKFIYFFKRDWNQDKKSITDNILSNLKFPVFVKPVHLGSSIGISKIKEEDIKELEQKIEVAFYYDNKVLVEESVENLMDVTCCVIGNEDLVASKLQESVFSAVLFDFEEKYIKQGGSQTGKAADSVIIPARLDGAVTLRIQEMAERVFKILGCGGIARVDFLYNKQTKEFFANEVNPLPGTLYHHLWQASGLELPELLQKLIQFAEEKYEQKREVNYSFESSVLRHLNSKKFKGAKLKS